MHLSFFPCSCKRDRSYTGWCERQKWVFAGLLVMVVAIETFSEIYITMKSHRFISLLFLPLHDKYITELYVRHNTTRQTRYMLFELKWHGCSFHLRQQIRC